MSNTPVIVVFTTTSSKDEADKLATGAVQKRHAACVQIISGIESVYEWKGGINVDKEFLLIIKTTADKFHGLEAYIKSSHSYDVPEIVGIPASEASSEYVAWLEKAIA